LSRSVEIDSSGREVVVATAPPRAAGRGWARTSQWAVSAALVALLCLGFGLRLSGISAIGFAEDEINKVDAVRAYEQGDIRPNAEHPMLMKALIYVFMHTARVWNRTAGDLNQMTDEAAVRFPNTLFGALTVLPLFLLTAAFFDRRTALLASALWACGINAITYNRIAKEDTLLVFFMLFAFYFYVRAKQAGAREQKTKQRNYILSGAAFGLMFASKYFPHYFGLNALYHHYFRVREPEPGESSGRTPSVFYLIIPIVFLIANPVVLLPQTWSYLQSYTSGQLLTHTGYLMGEHLYKNTMSATPFRGTPFYFYLLYLAIKVPLPVLAAFLVGLVECVRRRRNPGHAFLLFMFLFWIVPYSLMGAKWLRYTLSLMPFVYMIAAVGIMALTERCYSFFERRNRQGRAQFACIVTLLLIFLAWPAWIATASGPHYATYTNMIGEALAGFRGNVRATGYFFPHDEFYDDGLREAIQFVCKTAPQGATIVHETPGVVRYYLDKYGRTDLQSRVLSDSHFNVDPQQETYIILQRGRLYFENREKVEQIRLSFPLIFDVCVEGAPAASVYATKKSPNDALIHSCPRGNI
jgi:asparagine N-glycosylation enzyme membrane subunit Stt3